ncbi:MAG TPA: hypothetical protein DEP72_00075 [Clostridiales bacterium]|nr:MAG: hypothetical protein A2Y18_08385 [Clostridiales bacterium GWD2_32_19]HCC06548.1 hypothetical protein [Clostridiales bacterium]
MAYNLIPKEFKPQKPLYIAYILTGIYAIVCLGIGMIMFNASIKYSEPLAQNKENENLLILLKAEEQKLSGDFSTLNKNLENDQEYNAKVKLKREYETITKTYGFNYGDFIKKLGTITPMEVGIQSIQTENGNLIIETEAKSKEYFDIFENKLKDMKLFSHISSNVVGDENSKRYKTSCQK